MKAVKIIAAVIGVIVVVVVAGGAIIAANFDPDKYKPEITALVKEKTGRTLTIDGPLGLSVFPKLGVSAGKVQLSEAGSAKIFASLTEARVSLALLPLLSRQIVVDRIVLTGLNAEIVRGRDGRMNIDDLAGAGGADQAKPAAKDAGVDKGGAAGVKLEVEGVDIRADSLGWRDEADGTQLKILGLQLKTGRIADGAQGKLELVARVEGAKPKLALAVTASTGYRIDLAANAVALSGLSAKVEGDAPGAAGLLATIKGDIESDPGKGLMRVAGLDLAVRTKDGIDASLNFSKLSISKEGAESSDAKGAIKINRPGLSLDARLALAAGRSESKAGARVLSLARFDIDFSGKQGELSLQGKLATPVTVNLEAKTAQLAKLAGELTASGPSIPNKSLRVALDGQFATDWGRQTASSTLNAKLDESTLQSKFSVAGFSAPAITFDVAVDRLNVDRYLPPKSGGAGAAAAPASGSGATKSADAPIDLTALKGLNLNGQMRIGQLEASKVKVEKLQVGIRANGGRLDVNPLSASLYGGTLAGTASVSAAAAAGPNQFAFKQQLTGVNIGPLLRDLADKDMLEGKGNVAFDIQAAGATVGALKRALAGTASFNLKDGAIKGINLAESFRKAKSLLGAKSQEQGASKADKTDFAELSGSFVIRAGVAHNEDLSAKSPFIRLGGAGDIDIGASQMDYLAKASIVNTAGGQGAKELGDLKGLTIPVRLTGPFDALKYKIDFGAVATEAVKQQVQEKVQEKVRDQVQDRLKGLFKR